MPITWIHLLPIVVPGHKIDLAAASSEAVVLFLIHPIQYACLVAIPSPLRGL